MRTERLYLNIIRVVFAIIATIGILSLIFKIDADGQENIAKSRSAYFHELEGRYKEVLKHSLENEGMYNAGINITSIINIDGTRVYTVKIHHEKYDNFDECKRQEILESLGAISFADNETPVNLYFF